MTPDAADRELLRLTISLGQRVAPTIAESVAGEVITLYQVGLASPPSGPAAH
jgi:hypothetical protein